MGAYSDQWIVVPNWDKLQHYKDRTPAWIKLYVDINSDDDWTHLNYTERGLLVTIWAEYGRARGVLRAQDLHSIARLPTRHRHLERLIQAGLIQLSSSKPLALAHARTRSQEERREEERTTASSLLSAETPPPPA